MIRATFASHSSRLISCLDNPDAKPFVDAFVKKYNQQPENYSITAYDAALVIIDAIKRVADAGKEVVGAAPDAVGAPET